MTETTVPDNTVDSNDSDYQRVKILLPDIKNKGETLYQVIERVTQQTWLAIEKVQKYVCDIMGMDPADSEEPLI